MIATGLIGVLLGDSILVSGRAALRHADRRAPLVPAHRQTMAVG